MKQFRLIIHYPEQEVLPVILEAEDIERAGSIAERLLREHFGDNMLIQYSVEDRQDMRFYSITK